MMYVRQTDSRTTFNRDIFAVDAVPHITAHHNHCRIASHGHTTRSVVRATPQVNGRRQTYPSHHVHTPYPTVTRDYVHHISPHTTFDQDSPGGYFSPTARVSNPVFTEIEKPGGVLNRKTGFWLPVNPVFRF